MNFEQIKVRVVELLGEYNAGAAETSSATYSRATIFARITSKYRDMVAQIARNNAAEIAERVEIEYPAAEESIDISELDNDVNLWRRRIVSIMEVASSNIRNPLVEMTLSQYERAHTDGTLPDAVEDGASPYAFFVQNKLLHLLPIPQKILTLRVLYVPTIPDLDPGTDEDPQDQESAPDMLPEEFHELIAYRVAVSFRGETNSDTSGLALERQAKEREFTLWASGSARSGPRYVR